jgi:UDPglucose--hexose-1-phosphate uridylyltransferase
VVDWQGTVVRVVGKVRAEIVEFCDRLREKWNDYCNPALYLIPYDENGVYHAISPTVIKTERGYEMSVILRSNITSEEFPDGIFHAHPEFHMIKKESIGLIEAQGLFILPGRLEKQLGDLEEVIVSNQPLPAEYVPFKLVYDEVKALIHNEEKALGGNVHKAMQRELGSICNRILQNTAVFKDKNLLVEFLTEMGCNVQNKHN